MPTSTAKRRSLLKRRTRLLRLYRLLSKHFGPRNWWPADRAWEMMVGAILTQNTAWTNVKKALINLKAARALTLRRVATLPRRRLEKLIYPSGFFRQKAERLQVFARTLLKHPDFHRQLTGHGAPDPDLRQRLLSMNGIGPETADSILLYAGGHPTFVVDAYTRRIGQRIGLFSFDDYHRVQTFFQEALPRKAPLYNEYHALIVGLAKMYCRSRNPLCATCPVLNMCAFGKKRVRS